MKEKFSLRIIAFILSVVIALPLGIAQLSVIDAEAAVTETASVSAPAKGSSGYVKDDYVNLRSGAGTSYSVIACMRKNTKFTYVDGKLYNSVWYKIKLNSGSTVGYAHKDYLAVSKSTQTNASSNSSSATSGYVSDDYVNLRSGAGTSYSVITCMRKNTKFTLVSTSLYNKDWYKIKLSSNSKVGYVHKSYVKINTTTTNSNSSSNSNTSSNSNSNSSSGSSSNSGSSSSSSATTVTSGYITEDYVNLRSGAGTSYSVITCMRKNTKFTLVSTSLYNKYWYKIKLSSNSKVGYVHKSYVKITSTTTNSGLNSNSNSSSGSSGSNSSTTTSNPLKISATSKTIYVGNNFVLYVTGGSSIKWSSSNSSVAKVDSKGIITACKAGSATIKATSGKHSVSCKITVKSGSTVDITSKSIKNMRRWKSVLLESSTKGVKWETSNSSIATVDGGIVYAKNSGNVTITAYTSSGAASCLISIIGRDNIRFTYASPNSAPLNSTVEFKTHTDTDRIDVYFVVTNGSVSYKVQADKKEKDGNFYIWSGSKKLDKAGKWSVVAYSKYKTSNNYLTTPGAGEGEVFVTTSKDNTTPVCAERRASDDIINLIADYEGFLSKVTADSITSSPTLGYGKVILEGEHFYNSLTKNEAYAYLCQTVNKGGYTTKTNRFLLDNSIKFNQKQFDALVCFAYNVGASAIYNDSELKSVLLNTNEGAVKKGASGYVNGDYVNLRSGAGTNYSIVTTMDYGTKFTFVDGKIYNSNWYKIKLTNGKTGYIYKSYATAVGATTNNLNDVNLNDFVKSFCAYHHAAGDCYYGLLYRRIDETEVFFYGDYKRDGQKNKYNFEYTCSTDSSVSIS